MEPYRKSREEIISREDSLYKLVAGNRNEEERMKTIRRNSAELLTELDSTIDSVRRGQKSKAYDTVNTDLGERLFTEIQINLDECVKEEDAKLFVEVDHLYQARTLMLIMSVLSSVFLIAAAITVGVRIYRKRALLRGAYGPDEEGG